MDKVAIARTEASITVNKRIGIVIKIVAIHAPGIFDASCETIVVTIDIPKEPKINARSALSQSVPKGLVNSKEYRIKISKTSIKSKKEFPNTFPKNIVDLDTGIIRMKSIVPLSLALIEVLDKRLMPEKITADQRMPGANCA